MVVSSQWRHGEDRLGDRISAIAAEVLDVDVGDIDVHADLYEALGASSLEKAEIIARVEKEFAVVIGSEIVTSISDVAGVVGRADGRSR